MKELELNKNFSEISENDLYCVDGGATTGAVCGIAQILGLVTSGQGGSHTSSSGRTHGGASRRIY